MNVRFDGLSEDVYLAARQLEALWGAVAEFGERHCDVDRTGFRRGVPFHWTSPDAPVEWAVVYKTKGGAVVARVHKGVTRV